MYRVAAGGDRGGAGIHSRGGRVKVTRAGSGAGTGRWADGNIAVEIAEGLVGERSEGVSPLM